MMPLVQIVAALAAVALLFGNKIKALLVPNSPDIKLDTLEDHTTSLVRIATHLEAHGRATEAKKCVDLITALLAIHNEAPVNPINPPDPNAPVVAGRRRA